MRELIQVCYDLDYNTRKRELDALLKASKELRCNNLRVVTWDYEGVEEVDGRRVEFAPLWRWLLSKETDLFVAKLLTVQ